MSIFPKYIKHINTGAKFTVLSMNLGGKIEIRLFSKGLCTLKKGTIKQIDLSDIIGLTPNNERIANYQIIEC